MPSRAVENEPPRPFLVRPPRLRPIMGLVSSFSVPLVARRSISISSGVIGARRVGGRMIFASPFSEPLVARASAAASSGVI